MWWSLYDVAELRRGVTLDDLNSDDVVLYGPEKWKQNWGVKNLEEGLTTERYSANEKWVWSSCNAKSWYRSCLWCWCWCSLLVVKMIQICCLCVGVPCTRWRKATSATQSCKKKPLDACMMVTTLPREETRATSTHNQHQRRQLVH